VNYLLEELAGGHWMDCGEKVPGYAVATGGLHIAIAANSGAMDNAELRQIVNGMWAAADFIVGWLGSDDIDERLTRSLEAVRDACEWTGVPGEDAGRITRCLPMQG